jgi:hypothetical protein
VPIGGADLHRYHPEVIPSAEAGRSAICRAGGRAELRAATRHAAGHWPWPSVRVIYQPAGQGHGLHTVVAARDRLAEVEAQARRDFPAGLARWEVKPFSDGRQPLGAPGEDRFARLQNTNTGAPNALLDAVPDHPSPPPVSNATSEARAPPN